MRTGVSNGGGWRRFVREDGDEEGKRGNSQDIPYHTG